MAVQRNIWKPTFYRWPGFPCPSCKIGILRVNAKSISKHETAGSERLKGHDGWAPEWVKKRFNAILSCANPICEDTVFVCGDIQVRVDFYYDQDGDPEYIYDDYYSPSFFEPAPPVFPIPKECPNAVKDELKKAFALMWPETGSSGNRLRVAVEVLMNEQSIQKKAKIRNGPNTGKFQVLSLHDRIKKFAIKNKDAGTQLMAIKWLGNTGSHAALDVLTHDDLLDAFEHFEYAIDLVYVNKAKKLVERAEQIIKDKGPVRQAR